MAPRDELSPSDVESIERVATMLTTCRELLFVTGAGISADSGLPTYRGVGGLYDVGETEEGLSIEEILSGETFRRDPALVWRYLHRIEAACRGATFNRAHEVLAATEKHFHRVLILTQNVDGFHRAAGSTDVIDIHGDIHDLRCMDCGWGRRVENYDGLPEVPKCPQCGASVRPDVILFGEMLPLDKFRRLEEELELGFDAVFSIGTSSLFPYIAQPVLLARRMGIPTIEINPGRTEVSDVVMVRIRARAAPALDRLWRRYLEKSGKG